MRHGIHLPQFGRAASPAAVPAAARQAEELGYDDVWVSDHQVVPADQAYPPPWLYDPLMTLATAAAATTRVGLGTSVLVAPQYPSPLALANALASLDHLSGGRLTVGVGVGWSAAEYAALGAAFTDRGQRLDEIIDLWRTAWRDDPATHRGRFYPFEDVRLLPKPAHPVPVWVGGTSPAALRRAARRGDGYHGIRATPAEMAERVAVLRAEGAGADFTVSMRVGWGEGEPAGQVADRVAEYGEAGVDHVVVVPSRRDTAGWLADTEALATALDLPTAAAGPRLHAVFLGGDPAPGRMGEDHEVVLVVADDVKAARAAARAKWSGHGAGHVDAVLTVTEVDGWRVALEPGRGGPAPAVDTTYDPGP